MTELHLVVSVKHVELCTQMEGLKGLLSHYTAAMARLRRAQAAKQRQHRQQHGRLRKGRAGEFSSLNVNQGGDLPPLLRIPHDQAAAAEYAVQILRL